MNKFEYPKEIIDSVEELCKALRIHYPKAFEKLYDNFGIPSEKGVEFKDRMAMGVYIELMKAGVFDE
jgi:hypothetical protein